MNLDKIKLNDLLSSIENEGGLLEYLEKNHDHDTELNVLSFSDVSFFELNLLEDIEDILIKARYVMLKLYEHDSRE